MLITHLNDLDRLRLEYTDRSGRFVDSDIYSLFNRSNLFLIQQRQKAVISLLKRQDFYSSKECRTLELGCGDGGVLLEYLMYGFTPDCLHGTDLLLDRVRKAHARQPNLPLSCSDGQYLPYSKNAFDLILQYTVFSSILDEKIKRAMAREMLRVIRKPGGMILWYDFWINPINPHTRGIRPREIKSLFPNCCFEFQRITLAPPITRVLINYSWLACYLLERMRLFNTHYLIAIKPCGFQNG